MTWLGRVKDVILLQDRGDNSDSAVIRKYSGKLKEYRHSLKPAAAATQDKIVEFQNSWVVNWKDTI